VWIAVEDNGQYLNTDMVELFKVDLTDGSCTLNAHMPSGEAISISAHSSFDEGVEALDKLILKVAGSVPGGE
jgi:hypothetical protein